MRPKQIAAGVLPLCINTGRILLLRRPPSSSHAGCWSPPGGSFDEEDIYPKQTAIREFQEETGYDKGFSVSKQPLHILDDNHLIFYTYLGLLDSEFFPNLKGEAEVGLESDGFMWCYIDNLPKKMLPGAEKVLKERKKIVSLALKKYGK